MDKKKQVIISVIGVLTLTILVIGATYAYFQSVTSDASITDVNITSHTVDTLTFEGGDKLSLEITQDNFASGLGNLMSETTSSVTLTANSKTNTATEYYNLYFYIGLNEFSYTKDSDTPEVILQVYNGDSEVTDISTLDYKSVTDGNGDTISGYDITTTSGIIALYKDKEIVATPSTTDSYTFKIIFVNLDYDQSDNAGKRFIGDIVLTQEELEFILGDTNGDGIHDNLDVTYTYNIILNGGDLNRKFAADVNLDGIVDEIDQTIISNYDGGRVNLPYITEKKYNITYDFAGGENSGRLLPNYTSDFNFTITGSSRSIKKEGYTFLGFTCSNLEGYDTPQKSVTIPSGTTGDLHFVANWELDTSE